MREQLKRFQNLMLEIFELDKSDLDFGIYRIMNLRNVQIKKFLGESLPKMVEDTLNAVQDKGRKKDIEEEMREIEKAAETLGTTIDALPDNNIKKQNYLELKKQYENSPDISAMETDVYSALYSFFSRYYADGDFISKRRYKEDVYAIPYEGEEVKLYWANYDQYYVKTSENFKDYTFICENVSVHFQLMEATTEQNNNKENTNNKRTFMLFTEDNEKNPGIKRFEYTPASDSTPATIVIRFVYDIPSDKKKKNDETNLEAIVKWLNELNRPELRSLILPIYFNNGKDSTSILEKHLKNYTAKNTFNYFIHKDLRGFLTRELDFFIKSEIMNLEELDPDSPTHVQSYLAKISAIKRVGKVIIDFLAQIEDFQKMLWLKKKFVVETNWCITLDKINEEFWPDIIKNKAQIDEWIALYAIDKAPGWTNPPSNLDSDLAFLRANQNLIVDTKHFDANFKYALLASIPNLDNETNGLLIHSDNFQAIRFLQPCYDKKIQLTYIDPPYNTNASKILYKNGYEHSSWISLMESRLSESKKLMAPTGIIDVAIDDYEMRYLNICMDQVFGIDNAISNIAINTNPKGREQDFISQAHDYTIMYARDKRIAATHNFILTEEELKKKYPKIKDGKGVRELPLKRTGSGKWREDRPYMYFPFFYSPEKEQKKEELIVIPKEYYTHIYNKDADSFNDAYLDGIIKEYEDNGYVAILPLGSKNEKFRWRWGYESCVKGIEEGLLFCKKTQDGDYAVYQYSIENDNVTPKSLWFTERYDASSKGTNLLKDIIPDNPFDYPKSLYTVEDNIIIGSGEEDTVLDYFAGSGTTGHAVVDLNRQLEGSNRKYIMVEMGDHFYSVVCPRMKKIIYAPDWKDGTPQSRDRGVSQIMKYLSLESYEDTLSNIELADKSGQLKLPLDDYMIHYMFDFESRESLLNVDLFSKPFEYTLKITAKNESKERKIDLVETFNYLIGLKVTHQSRIEYYHSTPAADGAYEGAVDLEPAKDPLDAFAFQRIEGTLPDGRRAMVIWRTMAGISCDIKTYNAALDAYFNSCRESVDSSKLDIIFVNGDSNLECLRKSNEHWKIQLTEIAFKNNMFREV